MISLIGNITDKNILEAVEDEVEPGNENDPIAVVSREYDLGNLIADVKLRNGNIIKFKFYTDISPDAKFVGLFASKIK